MNGFVGDEHSAKMMGQAWGELPVVIDTESGIAAIEREQMTKPRPMDVEGPRLHQPSSQQLPPSCDPHPAENFAIDSVTMHTIKLIQHARKIKALIQNAHQTLDNTKSSESDIAALPEAPPIPEYEGAPLKHKLGTPVPFLPKITDSDFCRGIGKAPPVIDHNTCHQVLRRSVTAICAHAGFESCPDTILDLLTDVSNEYFLRMTQQLRAAVDNEALHGSTSFQDPVEQVFHEMGVGSTTTLHTFYQTRVLNYHQNMQRSCELLVAEYERLLNPDLPPTDDKASVRVKDEMVSDIQFPNAEEAEELLDPDQLLQLGEGLGLEINIVQDTPNNIAEEESVSGVKTEPAERRPPTPKRKLGSIDALTKKKLYDIVQSRAQIAAASMDSFDGDDAQQSGAEMPSTPRLGSDTGDSLKDPGSVPSSDIMSPPPARASKPKKKKKR